MKTYIGGHEAVTVDDFLELALGTPPELWLGVEDESEEERSARLDAARDILADNPHLYDTVTRVAASLIEARAVAPHRLTPVSRPRKNQGGQVAPGAEAA
ncbi:hypothetical protein [Streptomyces sp. ISL-11]|uniref:hypothetical protein n=1 Tax=Streptomyces sp. ISL-11 TaxID=2819174 RepID=UPI001BE976EA|nr:hypothetical protein [Streptomyces sp. ISL-11]MBT2383000.1 hypothetical protein [Streptomyces sp. ISL-11]